MKFLKTIFSKAENNKFLFGLTLKHLPVTADSALHLPECQIILKASTMSSNQGCNSDHLWSQGRSLEFTKGKKWQICFQTGPVNNKSSRNRTSLKNQAMTLLAACSISQRGLIPLEQRPIPVPSLFLQHRVRKHVPGLPLHSATENVIERRERRSARKLEKHEGGRVSTPDRQAVKRKRDRTKNR